MIYFDNSATTKVNPDVLATYNQVSENYWGNPSSLHNFGEKADQLLIQSRRQIASQLGVQPAEIFFTSGGTEGDNWVVKGTALAKRQFGRHLITTQVEHDAVKHSMQRMEELGFEVTYLPVDEEGRIRPDDLRQAIRSDTTLVSVMAVNNEMGAVQPLAEVAEILRDYPKIHFHVDAVQGIGKGLHDLIFNDRVDFVTFSGHKFHAPRGVGFIYGRTGKKLMPLLDGGGQERGQRSGTENLPAIAAMAKAVRLLKQHEQQTVATEQELRLNLRDYLQQFAKVHIFSGTGPHFAPHILCFAIEGVKGETIVHAFEEDDIYLSTTSACSSKKGLTSSTLSAMGVDPEIARGAVRISLSDQNTMAEVEQFKRVFAKLYEQFKTLS
ncbi:cysteine desulfurase family protein [Fructilactobacillus carniphilus]|uniref:Cysteine desulfurase n=1 Tax=Fructilactobacillus carniphilus TaxID=2940297 RepID=A0ABY5BXM6_9LACO|nr:cysteine desulfurase family protein [Fructilactobacillus carniphilus]USS91265.1 cysteine desulfurase [Fructilactobacillus carniphilus]